MWLWWVGYLPPLFISVISDSGERASLHFWPAPPEGGQNYLSVSSWDCKLGQASVRDYPPSPGCSNPRDCRCTSVCPRRERLICLLHRVKHALIIFKTYVYLHLHWNIDRIKKVFGVWEKNRKWTWLWPMTHLEQEWIPVQVCTLKGKGSNEAYTRQDNMACNTDWAFCVAILLFL